MKIFLTGIALISTIISLMSSSSVAARERINLNRDWEFSRGDSVWTAVNLPHDFQISQPWLAPSADDKGSKSDAANNAKSVLSPRGFKAMGKGYYRKTITPDPDWKDRRVLLDFGGIMLVGDIYLNGQRIGGTDYGYLGAEIDLTGKLRYGQPNIIEVVADTGQPNNSRWYTGGGLYRDVSLVITDPKLYIPRHGVAVTTPVATPDSAIVDLNVEIASRGAAAKVNVGIDIYDADGRKVVSQTQPVAVNKRWRQREYALAPIRLDNPRLWDVDSPRLYKGVITLTPEGTEKAVDSVEVTFGVRTVEFSPEFGMKLNGRKVLLKGIANHHSLGALGAAAYPRAIEKRIKLLKDFGFNHIRTSHNPYSEEFLEICDRNGIIVVDELYDKWLKQFAGGRKEWSELWQNDIPEFIKRDRNHPSVVMWSLGNELQHYSNLPFNDWGVTAYKLQRELLNRYDSTRPVTVAMHPRYRSLEGDSIPAPLALATDVASYNYRYMYFPGDARRYPDKIFYQSEASLSAMGPNFYEPDNDKVIGLAYWGMIDYLGESLGWPAKGWTDGVFDIALEPKPKAYFIKSMFTDDPVVHIAVNDGSGRIEDWNGIKIGSEGQTDIWDATPGDTVKITVYTNQAEVDLRLNGKSLGRRVNHFDDPTKRNQIVWDSVVVAPGRLEAIAYDSDGVRKASHRIETPGRAVRLVATADNPSWRADGVDLQHIRIHAVDSKGRRVGSADDLLSFELEGDGSIVAVANGDMCSDESYTGSTRSLHRGSAQVILRAGLTPGKLRLKVTSPRFPTLTLPLVTE